MTEIIYESAPRAIIVENITITGNLTKIAEDESASAWIGAFTIIWLFWQVYTFLHDWQGKLPLAATTYDPAVTYIWTLTGDAALWNSWLPTAYLGAWIFNFIIYFIEFIAWLAQGRFFAFWAEYFGLWCGAFFAAFPWVAALVYILSEYPIRQGGTAWPYIFYTEEFIMVFFQGALWLLSLIVHLIFVGPLKKFILAREIIANGGGGCRCDPCNLPGDEVERAQAEAICNAACKDKCPPEAPPCPLKQFEDEDIADYSRRCRAAAQLAQAAAERAEEEEAAFVDEEEEEERPFPDEEEPIDDLSSPEDEW